MEAPNGMRKKYVFFWIRNDGEKPPELSSWYTSLDLNPFRNRCHNKEKGSIFKDEGVVEITESEKVSVNPWGSREYKKLYCALEGKEVGEIINEMLHILKEGLEGNCMGLSVDELKHLQMVMDTIKDPRTKRDDIS
eukprot:9003300-Ditylum_brightwellii.AAC.1